MPARWRCGPRSNCCSYCSIPRQPLSGNRAEHPVFRVKILPHVCDELTVGRVVYRFDADDLRLERALVLVHVLDELEFRRAGSDDENFFDVGQGLGDLVVEVLRVGRMSVLRSDGRVPLHVTMGMRMNDRGVGGRRVYVEDLGFLVIDPNGGVHATADYQRHVAGVLIERALSAAYQRARDGQ